MFVLGKTSTVAQQVKNIFTADDEWFPYKVWEGHEDASVHPETAACQNMQQHFISTYYKVCDTLDGLEDFHCTLIKVPNERVDALWHAFYDQVRATERKGETDRYDAESHHLRDFAVELGLHEYGENGADAPPRKFTLRKTTIKGDTDYTYIAAFAHTHVREIVAEDIRQEHRYRE